MNAQEAARILAKENDSVVVVGIIREATGDLISDECFLNLDEFHAAVVCANLVGYIREEAMQAAMNDEHNKGCLVVYTQGLQSCTRQP